MNRPQRKRKNDHIIHGSIPARDIKCDYGVGPFDRLAIEMDRKWGIDKLPELVSPETAIKFGSAMAKLNEAIQANDPELVAHKAGVCIRGLQAMDAEAEAAGKPKVQGKYFEIEIDGEKIAILEDGRDWKAVKALRPDLKLHTVREAANALQVYQKAVPALQGVRQSFPEATITKISERSLTEELNDEIPF